MAVLLQYNLTSDLAPSTTASNVIGSNIQVDPGASLALSARESLGYASDPIYTIRPPDSTTSASEAITNISYFYITISPVSGYSLSLTSLDFDAARGGSATPRGYDVRSSADSYAVTLGTADLTAQRTTFQSVSVDLTGSEFQNLTSSTQFRIYVYAPNSGLSLDFDNITINGSVASSGTVDQEGFRWRDDDGSETTASWIDTQDTNIIREKSQTTRLRVLLNSTLDRGSENYRLEYRKVGDQTWEVIAP